MKFIKYNSIENVSNKQLYSFKNSHLYNPSDLWIVTPKIDGSNFAIIFENGEAVPCKRSSTMSMNSSFFNFQRIFDKYGKSFELLYNYLMTSIDYTSLIDKTESVIDVSFHGELFGGYYPDEPVIPNVKKVQKRVWYTNDTEFIMFDIRLYVSNCKYYFLSHEKLIELADMFKIPAVPILFKGTLDKALEWSSEHNADLDETWKMFNMSKEIDGNIREGHVIKPLHKTIFKGDSRVIFKDKNEKFKDNKGSKIKTKHVKIEYSDFLLELLESIDGYINYNRFCSVVSKFGDYSIRDFGTLMNLMVEDIEDELKREGSDEDLTFCDKSELHKILIKKVSAIFIQNKKEWF